MSSDEHIFRRVSGGNPPPPIRPQSEPGWFPERRPKPRQSYVVFGLALLLLAVMVGITAFMIGVLFDRF